MGSALEYHRATNVPAYGTDEDEDRMVDARPWPFKEYGAAERVPLDVSVAGPLLQRGAGIVRSRPIPGGTLHFRGYSSAGALYPVEAYVAAPNGLYSFDALGQTLVRMRSGDARALVADAAVAPELARAGAVIVLTGIHRRTGWKYLERGYRHIWWDAGTLLANVLALAAADGLRPRLYAAFVDRELNAVLGVNGTDEYALALLAVGEADAGRRDDSDLTSFADPAGRRFPLAEAAHAAASLDTEEAVRRWRAPAMGEEPALDGAELERAIRRRGSAREYSAVPLPREALADLLAWSEAPIPADAPPVVRQLVTVAAVQDLQPGIYDAELNLVRPLEEQQLRERIGFAAMEQDHPRAAAVNVFQLADLGAVADRLGERGYRWAQLEAGIRAGRLQVGAFARNWGAAGSTFFDDELADALGTTDAPMLMVAVGPRSSP